jgi:hypothetical protein
MNPQLPDAYFPPHKTRAAMAEEQLREGFLTEVKLVLRLTASAVTSAGQNRARGASWVGQMLMLPRIKEPVHCCTVQISLHLPRCIDLKHNTPTFCVSSLSFSLSHPSP